MARVIPQQRVGLLLQVATKTFIGRGYRLTQMADVAEALGVAKGTLYGYVQSKEALFDAALRYSDGHLPLPTADELPLATPAPGATVQYVRARLSAEAAELVLARVVSGTMVIRGADRELEAIVSDLYRRIARNRVAIKLIDRCAVDYPELGQVWFGDGRWAQHRLLVEWLELGAKRRRVRRLEHPELVARTILESAAFWAMHRHFDASPREVSDEAAERALIDLLANGLFERS